MKLLANPIVIRMVLVFVAGAFAFLLGSVLIRRMRRSFVPQESPQRESPSSNNLPLHAYQAVIQELKQQKHELQSLQQAERRRAKTSENISAAVLSHLSSGVLFITPNALVRQANGSARQILGFASPVGMSVAEIFREAVVIPGFESKVAIARVLETSLQQKAPYRRLETRYETPAGEERMLDLTVTAVHSPSGEVLGAACLINDQTELRRIREQEQRRGEMSAEMALELRNSLTLISECARQLAAEPNPEVAQKLAADVATEAEQLQRTIGGFLAGTGAAKAAAGI